MTDPHGAVAAGTARIVVLISGTGRNLQAILDACADGRVPGRVVRVISNRPQVGGLDRAARAGVPTTVLDHKRYADRAAFDAALADAVAAEAPDIVALAGFMRILTPGFIDRFAGKLLNIHPSLLPKYRGLHTHQRALDAGDAETGASVHLVTAELDGGPVAMRGRVPVLPGDTAQALADRVLEDVELRLYPAVIALMATGRLVAHDDTLRLDGLPLADPLELPPIERA